jgi:hypothetical protein
MEMAGKLAPGWQPSDHGVDVGARMRYQVARFGGPLPGVPHARLVGRVAIAMRARVVAG